MMAARARRRKGGKVASDTPPNVRAAASKLKKGTATSEDQKLLAAWRLRNKPKATPEQQQARKAERRSERLGPKNLRGRRTAPEDMVVGGKAVRKGDKVDDRDYARAGPAERAAIDAHTRGELLRSGGFKAGQAVSLRKTENGVVPHLGISSAKVERFGPEAQEAAQGLFGRKVHGSELATLAGAGDSARVSIVPGRRPGSLLITVQGDGYTAQRSVARSYQDGKPVLTNVEFIADNPGKGLGIAVFGRQVEQARRMGVARIETFAARRKGVYNGYYTWARFGYDGPLSPGARRYLPDSLKGAKRLSDLMKTPEGRDWWKAKGRSREMAFDLSDGSTSVKVWESYFAERIKRG